LEIAARPDSKLHFAKTPGGKGVWHALSFYEGRGAHGAHVSMFIQALAAKVWNRFRLKGGSKTAQGNALGWRFKN
jgi:hypothetical protein